MRKAKINNWFLTPVNDGKFVLKGETEGHPNPNMENGLHTTSPLQGIDIANLTATSQNTEYTLGAPVEVQPAQQQQVQA